MARGGGGEEGVLGNNHLYRNEGTVSVLQGSLPMEIMIEIFPHFSVCRLIGAVAWCAQRPYFVIFVLYV
jgi:hypothetical protein